MTLSEVSVRRPVAMAMVYAIICVIAIIFVPQLDIALYPSVDMPILSVSVSASEMGPSEVEEQVTKVLENRLSSIEGLKSLTSTSEKGSANIMLEFDYGADLDQLSNDVTTVISQVAASLPDWAETPVLRRFDSSSMPIMMMMVNGDLPADQLKALAEDDIAPILERVEGVASVDVRGGTTGEIHVLLSQNRLRAYNLSVSDIISALDARNIQTTGGTFVQNGTTDYQVTIDERFASIDDIAETVILATSNGVNIRLQDIGTVEMGAEKGERAVYLNGVSGIMLTVSNDSDSNELTVAKAVKAQMDAVGEVLPEGVNVEIISDDTTLIEDIMSDVYTNVLQGGLLSILAIFLFLRSLKSTTIITMALPISFLVTLMLMSIFNISVNTMSMIGLILGIGSILDASVVVLDNIYEFRERGHNSAVAAILGSREMFSAIVTSTLTNLCVFIPIIIYKNQLEMMGQMFSDLAFTMIISTTVSLFVGVTLVPALCGSILKLDTRVQKPLKNKFIRGIDALMAHFDRGMSKSYATSVSFVLRHRLAFLTLVSVLLLFSVLQVGELGVSLSPSMSSDDRVEMSMTLPVGTTQAVTQQYLFDMQKLLEEENITGYTAIIMQVDAGNTGSLQLNLPDLDEQTVSAAELQAQIRPLLSRWPEATWTFSAGRGPSSGNAIDIELKSDDSDAVLDVANDIIRILASEVPMITNLTSDLADGDPLVQVVVDQNLAYALGVDMNSVGTALEAAIDGSTASTTYRLDDDTAVNILVSLDDSEVTTIDDIGSLLVSSTNGMVRLDSFATLSEGNSPKTISREDKQRVNHVTADLLEGYAASEVQGLVESALARNLILPDSVELTYSGEAYEVDTFGSSIIIVLVIAFFLIYAVMAAQFESLSDPLIIILSVPLLAIGVIGIHILMGEIFSLYSAIAILALFGVVAGNGIILVDTINRLVREEGMPVVEACVTAAQTRLRPILMSVLPNILGVVPITFMADEGGDLMRAIGLTTLGGLATGAFLTLYVTPILYSLFNKKRAQHVSDANSLQNQLKELPVGV